MSKSKKPLPEKPDALTSEEIKALASALIDSSENVFVIIDSLFNKKAGEEIFDTLRDKEKIFRCEVCSIWKSIDKESDNYDFCKKMR